MLERVESIMGIVSIILLASFYGFFAIDAFRSFKDHPPTKKECEIDREVK